MNAYTFPRKAVKTEELKIKKEEQKGRPWVNFSVDGEVAGPIYFPKDKK